MKILYHHRTRGKDVERVHILGVVNGLRRLGCKVDILSPPGVDIDSSSINELQKFSWSRVVKKIPEIVFELMEVFYNITAYFKIKKIYKKSKIDGIYERYFLFSLATALFAKKAKIPLILEINDASFIERVRKLRMKRLASLIEKYTFNEASAIVAVSSKLKEMLIAHGIAKEKIWVVHNAVDPKIFSKDISGLSIRERYNLENKTVVGFVGSMVPWHGLQELMECAKVLGESDNNIRFLLVGDFKNLTSKTLQFAKSLNGQIILTGKVSHDKIPEYIGAMDICIMPNSNSFGSPMKIFEYMAMGKSVIAPDLEPLREIIKDEENGLLINPGDSEDMKRKIAHLISNRDLREKLGRNSIEYVLSNHTWDINSQRILGIFNRHYDLV